MHIRQPDSPHLKAYTFFVGRVRQPDGAHRVSLHMGYFPTLAEAERWVQLVRGRYPKAVAVPAPAEFLREPHAPAPQPLPAAALLTDTQVMDILETREVDPFRNAFADNAPAIPLVRPDDTTTRRVLKEAVAEGAPVSFALQLHWSTEPIDLKHLQLLPMFKGHLLYVTISQREDRLRYFLRLGFFSDPASAREVASQVRSKFTAAAVVPVSEEERLRAREPQMDLRVAPKIPAKAINTAAERQVPAAGAKSVREARRTPAGSEETLDSTLEMLASNEAWADPDSTSESGVRHLKVVVQKRRPGRFRPLTGSSS